MFSKLISVIMSFVISLSGFMTSALGNALDAVSELLFGVPYTATAMKYDFFSEFEDSDIVKLSEESGYINDKIAVFIDSDLSLSEKVKLFAECGGLLVGWSAPADLYVISYPAMTYDQVTAKCDELDKKAGVELSIPVMAYKTEPDMTPSDPFASTADAPLEWDEIVPEGDNWWLEAIDARQAWDYGAKFEKINIGVLDAGFETTHPELEGKITFPNDKQANRNYPDSHGTHVAGIIAANHNGVGIAGVCDNSTLICVDWMPELLQFWSTDISIFFGISNLVKAGAKVINMSLGTSGSKSSNSSGFVEKYIGAAATSYMMASLLSKGYDFIVVQSAGNGDIFGDPVDAKNNGHFASLTESNIYTGSTNVSKQDILDRILIVASVSNDGDGTYTQSEFTNVGANVSIAAPGENIYSSSLDGGYEYLSGTSMSAPIVTGVASLVWSVNPSFKGSEVKNILCTATDAVAEIYTAGEYYYELELMEYPVVNAKLAVEEAIRRSDSTVGTAAGRIIGNAESVVFDGVSHTVYSDGTYSFVAPEASGIAEVYDKYGNLIGSFELTVTAGTTTVAEDYNIELI